MLVLVVMAGSVFSLGKPMRTQVVKKLQDHAPQNAILYSPLSVREYSAHLALYLTEAKHSPNQNGRRYNKIFHGFRQWGALSW